MRDSHFQRPYFRRLGTGVTACVLAGALAACGSGASSGSSSGGTTTPAAAAGPTTDSGSGTTSNGITGTATTGDPKAHCDQITKAEVQPMFPSQPITKITVKAAGTTSKGQSCLFASADTSNVVFINVMSGDDAKNAYQTDTIGMGGHAVAMSGIGDKAARDGSHGDPIVTSMQGDLYCSVLPQIDDVAGVQQLMVAAGNSNNIDDKYFAEAAAAYGTLCNLVYGTGNTTPDLSALISAGSAAASSPTTAAELPTDFTLPTDSTP
jgi:hypothetical protein